jgi:M6 family metalloprotease-like protein
LRCRSRPFFLAISLVVASLPLAFPAEATMPTPSGRIPREVAEGFAKGLFTSVARQEGPGFTAAAPAIWRIPVVLAAFSDEDLTYSAADFDSALFGTRDAISTGSVRDYYRWASGGKLDVTGRVVATVRLPLRLQDYGDGHWGLAGREPSAYQAVVDALVLCQRNVDWSEFDLNHDGIVDMVWFVHSGKGGEASISDNRRLWSFTSRMTRDPGQTRQMFLTTQLVPGSTTEYMRLDPFSCLPELSGLIPGRRSEIGVFCHEFGHALGLPDLYDTSVLDQVVNVGPGNWSLMSTGAYGGNGIQPESPAHLGGWASAYLGWSSTIRPAQDTTITITPMSSGGPVVEFWFQGESNPEHFLLENRSRDSFDKSLVKGGLIVTHVDDGVIAQRNLPINRVNAGPTPGLQVVEADGDYDLFYGRNHGDTNDPFPGNMGVTSFDDETVPSTRTFKNAVTNIGLSGITQVGNDIRVAMRVRAPGWLPAEDHTLPPFQPYPSPSFGNPAALEPDGSISLVSGELLSGRPQVVLHRKSEVGWSPGTDLSASPAAAQAPAIAALPGGNAVVAWSDVRGGRSRIWGRVRLQGEWSQERVVADVPGDNGAPAIGADAHGRVYVTWLNTQNGQKRVYFTRFVYFAPYGQPLPVSPLGRNPDSPAIAVDEDGISYIMWPDLADTPRKLWCVRFHPDSGLAVPQTLTETAGAETGVSAVVDTAGTVHLVWQVTTSLGSEIHYERRFKSLRPAPRDTVLASNPIQTGNPRLALDPSGCLHLVYEFAVGGSTQVYYKRWRPRFGWDYSGTEISSALDGSASAPLVLARSAGDVSVLYIGYGDTGTRFMERRRQLVEAPPQAEPLAATVAAGPLVLRPNPLRAGQELELDWAGTAPGPEAVAELYDIAGRRVSAAALERRGGGAWRARFSGVVTARLSSGIYFVRPRAAGAAAQRLVILR